MKRKLRKSRRRAWVDALTEGQRRQLAQNLRDITEPMRAIERNLNRAAPRGRAGSR